MTNPLAAMKDGETISDLFAVLEEGRRAIGDHWAPNDCYATGPMTGDPIRDLIECPACSFIAMYDAVKVRRAAREAAAREDERNG